MSYSKMPSEISKPALWQSDVYIRAHGIYREDRSKMKRDPSLPYIKLEKNTEIFFYGKDGCAMNSILAETIIVGNLSDKTAFNTTTEDPDSKEEFSFLPHNTDQISCPYAKYTNNKWSGENAFYTRNVNGLQIALNYDLGMEDPNLPKTFVCGFLEKLRGLDNNKKKFTSTSFEPLLINNKYSLQSTIKYYKNKYKTLYKLEKSYKLRIHWTACRSFSRDNTDFSPQPSHDYMITMPHIKKLTDEQKTNLLDQIIPNGNTILSKLDSSNNRIAQLTKYRGIDKGWF